MSPYSPTFLTAHFGDQLNCRVAFLQIKEPLYLSVANSRMSNCLVDEFPLSEQLVAAGCGMLHGLDVVSCKWHTILLCSLSFAHRRIPEIVSIRLMISRPWQSFSQTEGKCTEGVKFSKMCRNLRKSPKIMSSRSSIVRNRQKNPALNLFRIFGPAPFFAFSKITETRF